MSELHSALMQLIGHAHTLRLIENYGGTRLYIPCGPDAGTFRVAQLLSPEAERALAREYGGTLLKIPLAKRWRAGIYRDQGLTLREIARRLGCTERGAAALIRPEPTANQLALPL